MIGVHSILTQPWEGGTRSFFLPQAPGVGKLPQKHTAACAEPTSPLGHLASEPKLFPLQSTWQSGEDAGLVPQEAEKSGCTQ